MTNAAARRRQDVEERVHQKHQRNHQEEYHLAHASKVPARRTVQLGLGIICQAGAVRAFVKYSLARIVLLVATYAALWGLVRLRWNVAPVDPFVGLAAIVVSAVISLFALRGLREDFAQHIHRRASAMTQRVEESRNASDLD